MMLKKAFSVVEILIAMAIVAVAVTVVTVSLSKLNSRQALDKSALLVSSVLDEARAKTLSSQGGSQYGVHFEDTQVVLFIGNAYSPATLSNVANRLDSRVGIRNITLSGGGNNIVFNRLTGQTNQSGTAELYLRASTTQYRTVNISSTGVVNTN